MHPYGPEMVLNPANRTVFIPRDLKEPAFLGSSYLAEVLALLVDAERISCKTAEQAYELWDQINPSRRDS
jgi:hypothetical protein